MYKKKSKIPWSIFIAITAAFLFGSFVGIEGGLFGITFYSLFDLIGTLFIKALTMIVVPLVSSSIILGVSKVGQDGSFGKLSLKIFSFYAATTLAAVLVGFLFVNILQPGYNDSLRASLANSPTGIAQQMATQEPIGISRLLLTLVPSNIFHAFASGEMLPIIFFSILFGFCASQLGQKTQVIRSFFEGLFETTLAMTHIIMKCLPLGVFCLVAKVACTTGFKTLSSLAMFFFTVLGALLFFSLVVLPCFLKFIGKLSPIAAFKAMTPALITGFSTSSSSATLPVSMDCAEKRAGVSNRICSLVIPLGTSLNMSGSALYECVGAMFIAQVYGIELSFVSQISVILLALLTSMGVAGIPAASLVALMIILKACGLPLEGIALFLAVDRILDMCRTVVNLLSDSCCAMLVAKSEGEVLLQKKIDV